MSALGGKLPKRLLGVRGWRRFEGGRIVPPSHQGGERHAQLAYVCDFIRSAAVRLRQRIGSNEPNVRCADKSGTPFNIGFVLYTKGKAPGTLDARWNYGNAYSGHGVATGGPVSGAFAGRYHVRYFLESGEFSDEYDLDIKKHIGGDFYDLIWNANGKVIAKGVGMEVPNDGGLAVGWRRVAD
jgi:hypothetical protein